MIEQTHLQRQIENIVTTGRGYDKRKNTARTPSYLMDKEIGLQIALANMEMCDGKIGGIEQLNFSGQLNKLLTVYEDSGIPLSSITDASGFNIALNGVGFKKEKIEELEEMEFRKYGLEQRSRKVYYPKDKRNKNLDYKKDTFN
jgi:hypothetical protein